MKTTAFESFWRSSQFSKLHPVRSDVAKFDINPEGELLREAQSIGDELRIMASHLKTQSQVIEEFSILFKERAINSNMLREMDTQTKNLRSLEQQMTSRQGDIEDLMEGAASVYRGVSASRPVIVAHASLTHI
jgi:predicted lipase